MFCNVLSIYRLNSWHSSLEGFTVRYLSSIAMCWHQEKYTFWLSIDRFCFRSISFPFRFHSFFFFSWRQPKQWIHNKSIVKQICVQCDKLHWHGANRSLRCFKHLSKFDWKCFSIFFSYVCVLFACTKDFPNRIRSLFFFFFWLLCSEIFVKSGAKVTSHKVYVVHNL